MVGGNEPYAMRSTFIAVHAPVPGADRSDFAEAHLAAQGQTTGRLVGPVVRQLVGRTGRSNAGSHDAHLASTR